MNFHFRLLRQSLRSLFIFFWSFQVNVSTAQNTYIDTVSFTHNGRTKVYGKRIIPRNGYYAVKVAYTNDRQHGCNWCFPNDKNMGTPKIESYGQSVLLSTKCDGMPCNFSYYITYKKAVINDALIQVKKDLEENLSSNIWVENKSSEPVDLVYKVETYNSSTKRYESRITSIRIVAYDVVRVMPRYIKVDNTLREEFFTPLYTL